MVRKLADRLGVTELNDFNDVVPLFFSHTAFKSYPAALIDNKRFDLMTQWLDKLTSHDCPAWTPTAATASTSGSTGSTSRRRLKSSPQRHDGNLVDHPEGQARRARRHGAVEDLPVPDVRRGTHRSGAQSRGRRHLAQLRQRQARSPAHRGDDQARVHRRRREQVPCALPRRHRHRPDVPGLQDARRRVAR